jgi:CHAD domain-containing protein
MPKGSGDGRAQVCRYGAWFLSRVALEFREEIEVVKEGRDVEAVHRMRVTSRRLRAGLPLFSQCFPGKAYKKISGGIRRITRDLGDARDLDVQIGYLEALIEEHRDDGGPAVDGCTILLSMKRTRREALQPKVVADCTRLEQKGVIELLEAGIAAWSGPGSILRESPPGGFPMKRSGSAIKRRAEKLESYSPMVQDPSAVEAHHAMRIAAKRLRYLLEVYAPLYRKEFRPAIRQLKRLQEILGNLHDCDVWIADLQEALGKGRKPAGTLDPVLDEGMVFVLKDRRKARDEYYLLLKKEWEALEAGGFCPHIREIASSGSRR